jgi:anaphase-promoting complex subunit 2
MREEYDDDDEEEEEQDDQQDNQEAETAFFESVRILGWIRSDGMLQQPLGEALHQTILSWVSNTIAKEFEEDGLYEQVQDYKNRVVLPWLTELVGEDAIEREGWQSRLEFAVAECFCLVRMQEIFELVAEYPDSHPAVIELKKVLEITRMHQDTARALKTALIRRLNHPGANTSQIIDVYINTIKVFREIDPSDRLLQVVAEPVRSYLRQRKNTVRCIITSLTDSKMGGDLYEELRRQDARPLEQLQVDSDDEEEPPDMDWVPPPPLNKERQGNFLGTGRKGGGDILSMLVSIYGSKDLFVDEFRLMLADKLLASLTFNTDQEVHTLELLKLRFGEISMRNCEVMIKDIDDSKRVITNIHNTIKSKQGTTANPVVDAAIVSHIFWPTLQKQQFKHHARIQTELDQFSTQYGQLKNPRRLVWMNQLGSVQLELDVVEEKADGTVAVETREFSVAPLLATLISHFEDKDQWTAEELSDETGLAEHVIQKRMGYWVNNRVIKLLPGHPVRYEVATRDHLMQGDNNPHSGVASMMDDDGSEGQAVSVFAQEEEEIELFESFIMGMLANMGQLPLSRIHNMLKMVSGEGSDVKYTKTLQQLSMFLQHLCKQDKIECGPDGMYKLIKK